MIIAIVHYKLYNAIAIQFLKNSAPAVSNLEVSSTLPSPTLTRRFRHKLLSSSSLSKPVSPSAVTPPPSQTSPVSKICAHSPTSPVVKLSTPFGALSTPIKNVSFDLGVSIAMTPSPPTMPTPSQTSPVYKICAPLSPTSSSTPQEAQPEICTVSVADVMDSPTKRQPTDYALCLPKMWTNIAEADKAWIGRYVFSSKNNLSSQLKNWYHPPTLSTVQKKPKAADYFLRNLFLWMPNKMWGFAFECPVRTCKKQLRKKGIYNNVRLVLDVQDYYYMATEYLSCICGGTYQSWDPRLLKQLPYGTKCKFPAVLTYKYAVDKSLLTMLRSRTLGNSSTSLHNTVKELHSENWLRRGAMYLQDCVRHQDGIGRLFQGNVTYDRVPIFKTIPTAKWFLSTYAQDVMSRSHILKGNITSVFGQILKIDSTKKILRKLSGDIRDTSSWLTNVGNEYGGILQCVVTSSEANDSLEKMASGILDRYSAADVPPPKAIYTDRDCCNQRGPSKIQALFQPWSNLHVRLDIWHFMRRIAVGCTSGPDASTARSCRKRRTSPSST